MRKGPVIFWSIFIVAAIFRVSQSFGVEKTNIGPCVKEIVLGSGLVNEEPERKESGQVVVVLTDSLTVVSTSRKCETGFMIRMKTKLYPRFEFGDQVSFKGKLLKPMNFFDKDDPGRSFDYEGYLAKSDIFYEIKSAQMWFVDKSLADHLGGHDGDTVITIQRSWHENFLYRLKYVLYSLKRRFVSNLEKTLGEPHSALASGLVVGEKAALGNDLLDVFRTVGLIHIVVLSGYNITIVGVAIGKVLSFLPRVWKILTGGVGIVLFGILVGGGATVVRSCFMASVAVSADIIRRDYNVMRALIFVGLIMLIQNPMILLHDPSFQLSFLATMGLVLLGRPIEERLEFVTEKFGLRGIIAATLSTQIFVSPYILYMMGDLSLVGILANIVVLPVIPITMLFVFVTGATGMISLSLAQVFAWVSHLLLSYELFIVQLFAKIPLASIHLPAFSKWWVIGFYGIFMTIFFWRKWKTGR